MIHILGKILFVHIPRTAGMSIERGLSAAFPAAHLDQTTRMHATARELRDLVGEEEWERCYRFAVLRDPLEIIESDWRHSQACARRFAGDPLAWDPDWRARLDRMAAHTFDSFVRDEWLGEHSPLLPGGFWRTWCLGLWRESLGVDLWRFDALQRRWSWLGERFGFSAPLPRVNAAAGAALVADLRPDVEIVSVDDFVFCPLNLGLWQANQRPNMRLFVGRTDQFAAVAAPGAFAAVLVDADHSREGTLRDLEIAARLVRPDGVILAHDCGDPSWPGVDEAVKEFTRAAVWRLDRVCNSLAILRRADAA